MSGICGLVALDGREPGAPDIASILNAMKRRGPDGLRSWAKGNAAIGQALLATTQEALREFVPLELALAGMVITGDVRLDNRAELAGALGLERSGAGVGDCEFVLRAYLQWGEDCLSRLLGDFAFAIWDGHRRRLFAARDPMGMRQLCFAYQPGRHFVFATDPQAVASHADVGRRVNRNRIAHYLVQFETADLEATFFDGVQRLRAAHRLTLDSSGLRIERYWQPNVPPMLRLTSDADYAEALRETLDRAIEPRLRSRTRVGATLSGGIDSASVCASAAALLEDMGRGPLDTYSVVGVDPATCAETRAIHQALEIPNLRPHLITIGSQDDLTARLIELARNLDDPFDASMNVPRAAFLAASRDGITSMFVGVGGDITLSVPSHVARLLRRGSLGEAWREARGERSYWGPSWPAWRPFGRGLVQAFAPPLWDLRLSLRSRAEARRRRRLGLLAPELERSTDLAARRRATERRDRRLFRVDREELARHITGPNFQVGLERYERVAAACGVEVRDPFLDLRFIDFCLSLPFEQLQHGGYPKPALRRAMARRIPKEVRWRRGKEHLGFALTQSLAAQIWSSQSLEMLKDLIHPRVLAASRRIWSDVHAENLRIDLLALNKWLERQKIG